VSLQPQYSLVERHIEYEILPVCQEELIGVLPWGPLGGGFLSGKYRKSQQPPEGSRIPATPEQNEESWKHRATEYNREIIETIGEIAQETGMSYAQIALNWLIRQPAGHDDGSSRASGLRLSRCRRASFRALGR
jgi:aryl-alcohol dehydrogenase-like predicted oxidoreductase